VFSFVHLVARCPKISPGWNRNENRARFGNVVSFGTFLNCGAMRAARIEFVPVVVVGFLSVPIGYGNARTVIICRAVKFTLVCHGGGGGGGVVWWWWSFGGQFVGGVPFLHKGRYGIVAYGAFGIFKRCKKCPSDYFAG